MNVKSHISKYGKIIEDLRQEVSEISVKFVNIAVLILSFPKAVIL